MAQQLTRVWGWTLNKMPTRYQLDYLATDREGATAFCEMKRRHYTWGDIDRLGGYMLSLGKWLAARSLCHATGLPFMLVVHANDGMHYRYSHSFEPPRIVIGGRTDRDDWQDVEPCAILKCAEFRLMP